MKKPLLEEILEQMVLVDLSQGDASTNPKPVADGEEVLGLLSDPLKRLFVVLTEKSKKVFAECDRVHAEVDRLEAESKGTSTEAEAYAQAAVLAAEHQEDHRRRKIVHDIFWALVTSEFPKTDEDEFAVGVRQGWQVVVYPNKQQSDPRLMGIHIGPPIFLDGESGIGEALMQLMGAEGGNGPRPPARHRMSREDLMEALGGMFGRS
jgi:hypothetical protein